MSDPLAQVVGLLQPSAAFSKLVTAFGAWSVRRSEQGRPFYCAVLDGACRLSIAQQPSISLQSGDFVLVPAAYDFVTGSIDPAPAGREPQPIEVGPGEFRVGTAEQPFGVRMLIGHCSFASPDTDLLISLLPRVIHLQGQGRLTTLVGLVDAETRTFRPGRDLVLTRLLEVMLIEALRSTTKQGAPPGLLRGLADERLAIALRRMHESPAAAWTVAQLARECALSRSAFFVRFRRAVGVTPMEYLLGWRMALAKDLLRQGKTAVALVVSRVGYSSPSTFSSAFARHVGVPPMNYGRQQRAEEP